MENDSRNLGSLGGILSLRIIEEMEKKYNNRVHDVIYAHMLDDTVYKALSGGDRERDVNGSMVIGEMLHMALEQVFPGDGEKCRRLHVTPPAEAVEEAVERFVKIGGDGRRYVEICGSPDGMYGVIPVELKTTRNQKLLSKPRREWVSRARLYAWLTGSQTAYLIVVDVISGREANHLVTAYTDEDVKGIVEEWLAGNYPRRTLRF